MVFFKEWENFSALPRGNSLLKLAKAEALQRRRLQEPLLNTSCVPTNTPQSTERGDTTAEARQARLNSKRGKRLSIKKTAKNVWSAFSVSVQYVIPKAQLSVWKKLLGAVLRDRKREIKALEEEELSVPLILWCVELARQGALSQQATMRAGFDCLLEPKLKS